MHGRARPHEVCARAWQQAQRRRSLLRLSRAAAIVVVGTTPTSTSAQQAATTSLVFDGVTVVDVMQGKLLPAYRVVITGNRIQSVGEVGTVKMPEQAQVIDARGKYLIPGLWDTHVHTTKQVGPLLLAYGITGMRDAWSWIPLDTLIQWRREILAGRRVGPPRQILSGPAIDEADSAGGMPAEASGCTWKPKDWTGHICVRSLRADSSYARQLVDSLKAAGVDMLKIYSVSRNMYFALAKEARRLGLPFGGHRQEKVDVLEASDSGATILDHIGIGTRRLNGYCPDSIVHTPRCGTSVAEQFRRNGTWLVYTGLIAEWLQDKQGAPSDRPTPPQTKLIYDDLVARTQMYWSGSPPPVGIIWPSLSQNSDLDATPPDSNGSTDAVDNFDYMAVAHRAGLPLISGTDVGYGDTSLDLLPGLVLHAELAIDVAEGLTPLEALRASTLNPAKMLHATDSLGTVAAGKLADLVLLDADPLTNIANTTAIRAVVANGRYYDRAALDQILVKVRNEAP